jgi:hypothetical protein
MSLGRRHQKLQPVAPIGGMAAASCAVAGAWALWLTPASSIPTAEALLASIQPRATAEPVDPAERAFDTAAFHAPLWVAAAPEPAPEPERPLPPPPPLRATLLAIARDASHAIVHDQEGDKIMTLRVGDQFQGRVVSLIEPARVTLTLDGRAQTLDLGYSVGAARQLTRHDAAAVAALEGCP